MTSLASRLTGIMGEIFDRLDLPAERAVVRVSDRPDLCQFQCNGAMAVAKAAGENPREVAGDIAGVLEERSEFSKVEIAGPGFINLDITDEFLTAHLAEISSDERAGIPETGEEKTVILDYGGMNVAKAMHVGHLRPTVIGDCLKYIIRFAGYNALGDIHMGDWGLQMGQIISEFELRNPQWPYFDEANEGPYPEEPPFSYEELEKLYPEASAACKEDDARLELARKATADLQEGRAGYIALWRHFMSLSIADIKANLEPLGVEFEIWKGEADVNDLIAEISEELKAKGILEESQGAWIIKVAREDDNQDIPPLIFFKSDGALTYGTTDIGTIYDRIKSHDDLVWMIYVNDKRQTLHFEQVFRACEMTGYSDGMKMTHIGNGTINGEDGRPFKTREGKALRFAEMVKTAIDKADARLQEADLAQDMSTEEHAEVARKVAVAALKFNELLNQAHVDYVFDLDRMTSFEGKTGPYLLYQAVRINSLLKKAGAGDYAITKIEEGDKTLALLLAELPDHFEAALKNYTPHVLCEYAYKLAQTFSSFYGNCHILSEKDDALRSSRLALCAQTYKQLELVLSLLGVEIPERM